MYPVKPRKKTRMTSGQEKIDCSVLQVITSYNPQIRNEPRLNSDEILYYIISMERRPTSHFCERRKKKEEEE